jgi:hypothetical protein
MKPGETLYWNHYFTVRIATPRKWVRWGYAKDGEKPPPMHIEPKMVKMGTGDFEFEFEFELPKGFDVDGQHYRAEIADEVESWGWCLYSHDTFSGENWHLSDSKDGCLRDAKKFFQLHGLIPEGVDVFNTDGVSIREPLDAEWQDFAKEAFAAVDSWQTGKGWPSGWKGKE